MSDIDDLEAISAQRRLGSNEPVKDRRAKRRPTFPQPRRSIAAVQKNSVSHRQKPISLAPVKALAEPEE